MLRCENYKMFYGTMRITPPNPQLAPLEIEATWLYKPEYDCWYGKGSSYPASVCAIVEDKTDGIDQ